MFDLKLKVENFLAIKKAELRSKNNITVLVAPNRAGKTQMMLLLYSIFWSWWKVSKDNNFLELYGGTIMRDLYPEFKKSREFEKELKEKMQNVFLLKKSVDEVLSWSGNKYNVLLTSNYLLTTFKGKPFTVKEFDVKNFQFFKFVQTSPIYLQLSGLGDYYKGIYSLKKYYPKWKLISEAITDLINDLFIVADEKVEPEGKNRELMELFENLFSAKFFIQNRRIYIQEKGRKYGLEKTASGLKSLSWFYLILRYNLLGGILFVDEPEVNLHPTYIDRLVYFLCNLAKNRKIFIATHSDYLLESLNKFISKENVKVDVWIGDLKDNGAYYSHYEADKDNLIDTSPLVDVYLDILKEGFGHE